MKLKDYITELVREVEVNPEAGEYQVIYSSDYEGNEFHPASPRGIMYVEDDKQYYIEPIFEDDNGDFIGVPVYCVN